VIIVRGALWQRACSLETLEALAHHHHPPPEAGSTALV
jgi:hypothetical protein